jgi:hypothetical protein
MTERRKWVEKNVSVVIIAQTIPGTHLQHRRSGRADLITYWWHVFTAVAIPRPPVLRPRRCQCRANTRRRRPRPIPTTRYFFLFLFYFIFFFFFFFTVKNVSRALYPRTIYVRHRLTCTCTYIPIFLGLR